MSVNRGKDFESVIKEGIEGVEGAYVLRLYDPQGGYVSVANPCDFIAYYRHQMCMFECKTIHGNTLPIFSNDPKRKYGNISNTQWDGLLSAAGCYIASGVICWWIDRDVTVFIPITFLQWWRDNGHKSVQYGIVEQDFSDRDDAPIVIKGTKKRIYFDYDFADFFQKLIDKH